MLFSIFFLRALEERVKFRNRFRKEINVLFQALLSQLRKVWIWSKSRLFEISTPEFTLVNEDVKISK